MDEFPVPAKNSLFRWSRESWFNALEFTTVRLNVE
jgi:hypothetical protein